MTVTTFLELHLLFYFLTCFSRLGGEYYSLFTEAYLRPYQTSTMESFGVNSQQLKAIIFFRKKAALYCHRRFIGSKTRL